MHTLKDMMEAGRTTMRGVHWWEKKGLLGPVERTAGGNRRYTREQIDRARIIAACHLVAMPLDQVKIVVEDFENHRHALALELANRACDLAQAANNLPEAMEYDL